MNEVTVAGAVESFLQDQKPCVAPATWALYRSYLRSFATYCEGEIVARITPTSVRAWGRSFHKLQAVKRLTRWCLTEAKLIERDPLEGMKLPRVGRRLRTLSTVELVRLARAAGPAVRRLVVALGESFARPHELRGATWSQVVVAGLAPAKDAELVQGVAFLFRERFKSQWRRRDGTAVRVIPISPRLGRLLVRLRRRNEDLHGHLFVNSRGAPWTVNAVRCAFRRLRARAGLVVDHRGERVVAYTLRHTAATAAIVGGVPIADLAGALGHSDIRMTHRYVHLSPAFLARVVQRMDQAKRGARRKNDLPGSLRTRPDDLG